MSISNLRECAQEMAKLISEINQLTELSFRDYNSGQQQLSTLRSKLSSLKIYANEILDELEFWHKITSQFKHDLCLFFLAGMGVFIGIFFSFHFLRH
ncbi:MAG TPA: hypothetical protein VHE99_04010 [Gammaproteobacteria bacterium]|nr:hypothetical protein [Gammaproteobacteria bacterium]